MNKLSKKFIIGIAAVLCLTCVCTILFNTFFLERYYLYQKRNALSSVSEKLVEKMSQGTDIEEAITQIEDSDKVIVVKIEEFRSKSNDTINEEIRVAFQLKGIGFQKYWLWIEDHQKILDGDTWQHLYTQDKLNDSLLVEYRQIDSSLYVVTMIIPNIADAFGIINTFLIAVNVVSIIISIFVIILLIKKIVKPLAEFQVFASQMENNQFIPLQVQTKDELEQVADSLNSMGKRIMDYQDSLQEKNKQMEQLMDNVAHDLKTPISLIHLYASGLKDGLDDGTFLDTILDENHQMEDMVNRLLYLSRIDKEEYEETYINLSELIRRLVDKYSVMAEKNHLNIRADLEEGICITASEELIISMFTNLVTNAIKYSSGSEISIELLRREKQIVFIVSNETDNQSLDVSKIWNPYYVGEKSRNKNLSGTGLGLSIVQKICETQHYLADCSLCDRNIVFTVAIPC